MSQPHHQWTGASFSAAGRTLVNSMNNDLHRSAITDLPRPARASVLSKVSMHDGSVLVVLGSPEAIWREASDGRLLVHLLGGGFAHIRADQVYATTLFRRVAPVSAVAEPSS